MIATCGSVTFKIRTDRIYPHTDRHEYVRFWSVGFFYVKDTEDPASTKMLPAFKDGPAAETSAWTDNPHISDHPEMENMARRISKLLDLLEEKDLWILIRNPQTESSNPGGASDTENPKAAPPAKRKRGVASGSKAKRPRESPNTKTTKKLEKDKLRLKEIDTSSRKQGSIEQFFTKFG
ncbi:hypothetical protein QYE76_033486 [Lolium multiflorum]|uniref:Uncharacterized protein n=1 Tax=Lolium multiflorum TaxID=4521 RepID=A0AAD8VME3_LOLMU|nr:hypothetical protein QYE76_033486 [Lolium multiflorum]